MNTPKIIIRNKFYRGAGKAGRGTKAVARKLSAHFKYLEHRPQDGQERREDRSIFTAQRDQVSRREAVNDVMAHRSHRVDYHHLLLSPDPQEPVHDLREWTRTVMHDLEQAKGLDLHWYAVQHHNTVSHPHVHVVIAGGAQAPTGQLAPVTIFEPERNLLHTSALEHSDHELYQLMEQEHQHGIHALAQEPEHEIPLRRHESLER